MPPFGLGDETAKLHAVMVRLPVFLSSTVGLAPETRRPANGGSEATSAAVMANAIRRLIAVMPTRDSRIAPYSFLCILCVASISSVDAAGYLQRGRVGPEAADGGFPHLVRRRLEDQIAIDIAHQPRRRFELRFELAGTPA